MVTYQEIERSIIKTYRKEIWSKFIKAVSDYELIKENDKIMVCISGGKDSFLLAKCIEELIKHGKFKFDAHYVVMNPGYLEKNKNLILEEILDNESKMKEYMMLGLRKIEGVNIFRFESKFGKNPIVKFCKELEKLNHEGLIEVDGSNIKLTDKGIDLANLVWEEFI